MWLMLSLWFIVNAAIVHLNTNNTVYLQKYPYKIFLESLADEVFKETLYNMGRMAICVNNNRLNCFHY